jgi:hypothetical protein
VPAMLVPRGTGALAVGAMKIVVMGVDVQA